MTVYGFINTKKSQAYLKFALSSFFKYTRLSSDDVVMIIDNDNSLENNDIYQHPIKVIKNKAPLGFAKNANKILLTARESKQPAYVMNNDLYFTPSWNEGYEDEDSLLSPVSNAYINIKHGELNIKPIMDLDSLYEHENDLEDFVFKYKKTMAKTLLKVGFVAFFCIKIPYKIQIDVGLFDEGFGKGGAEDNDYCIRAYLKGWKVCLVQNSFIIHFGGKSTWQGAETKEETRIRDKLYSDYFKEKWGGGLFAFYLPRFAALENIRLPQNDKTIAALYRRGDFRALIEYLLNLSI